AADHRKNSIFASRTKRKFPGAAEIGPLIAKHGDLEPVANGHGAVGQHHAVGHVEALDRPWTRPAGSARHRAVDPDFGVVVDVDAQYSLGACAVETRDIRRHRQDGTEPEATARRGPPIRLPSSGQRRAPAGSTAPGAAPAGARVRPWAGPT